MNRIPRDQIFQSGLLTQGLAQKTVRGGMTTMGSQGVKFVLGIAGTVILARLLTPADYGIIGMVTVVVNFAAMFKDAGLSMATVQKEEITHEQISTLFWLNILISGALGFCVLASSPLVAWFYGKPELTAVTVALSFSFIISGLTIQHQALLQRHMRFDMLVSIQIASQITTLIVTIGLACVGWRYWALVGGTLASTLVGTLLTFIFCPWIPGRMQRGIGVREMLNFGGYVTGGNIVNYFSSNIDNILIGKFIGASALGLYTKAYQLFMLPITQTRGPIQQVAIPVLSSLKNQPERFIMYYRRILDVLATLMMPMAFYCAVEANFIINLMLGPQWLNVVPIFRILSIAGIIRAVTSIWGLVPLSCGFPDRYFKWGAINCFVTIAAISFGLPFGIMGVALSLVIADYALFLPCLLYCFKKTPIKVSMFLKTLIGPFITSGLTGGISLIIHQRFMSDSIGGDLLFAFIFGMIYILLSFCRGSVRQILTLLVKGFTSRGECYSVK